MTAFKLLGLLLGYPTCCIKEFEEYFNAIKSGNYKPREDRKLKGTGYVPCETCNEKYSESQLIENIEENRVYRVPFPAKTMPEIDNLMNRLQDE